MWASALLSIASVASLSVRAASLDLCADEYLLSLADPGQIVSVSRLSHDPLDSPLWQSARRHPSNRGSLEDVLARRPTLLVTMAGGGHATQLIAQRLNVRTLRLPYPQSIEDVKSNMDKVADALGRQQRALAWRQRLRDLTRPSRRQRDTIFMTGGGATPSATSLSAQWMALAGFRQRPISGGRVSLESLAVYPPADLLWSDYRRGQMSLSQQWKSHPLLARLPSRRVETDGRPWTCAGPLMLPEIERLRRL